MNIFGSVKMKVKQFLCVFVMLMGCGQKAERPTTTDAVKASNGKANDVKIISETLEIEGSKDKGAFIANEKITARGSFEVPDDKVKMAVAMVSLYVVHKDGKTTIMDTANPILKKKGSGKYEFEGSVKAPKPGSYLLKVEAFSEIGAHVYPVVDKKVVEFVSK